MSDLELRENDVWDITTRSPLTRIDDLTQAEIEQEGTYTLQEVNERIRELLDLAPSDSSAEILMRKVSDGYKGYVKITSQTRKFVGGSTRDSVTDFLDKAFSDIERQIADWKRHRNVRNDDN